MKPMLNTALVAALLLSCSTVMPSSVQAQAAAARAPLPVGKCINIGNTLEPQQEGSWGGKPLQRADFTRIKAAGFNTIRLPVRWHNKSLETPPYTVEAEWMARVKEVVDWAIAADLNVILNSHHFDPIHEDPAATAAWHGGVWAQIADQFKGYDEAKLWFELENEPHKNFTHANLLATLDPALKAVRQTNPTRAVIIGGENWSGIDSLATLPLPNDPNIHATFHYYDPFDYTHQGAEWTKPGMPAPGRRYGTAADAARLAADVQKVRAFTARTGMVPFMGETGAYDAHSPTAERAAYHRAIRDAFAPTGIGVCAWGYSNTFPFWDNDKQQWLPGMLGAFGLGPDDVPAASAVAPRAAAPAPTGPHPSLPQDLHALDAALPGQLANDPRNLEWVTYGKDFRARGYADPSIPGGGAALKFDIRKAGQLFDVGANVPLLIPVADGEVITVGFYARATAGDGRLGVRFQQNAAPYPGFGDRTLTIGRDWAWHEVSATANRALSSQDGIVAFQLGGAQQTIEIGQTIVVKGAASILGGR